MTQDILIIGGSYFVGRVCVETLASDPFNRIWVVNRGNRPLALPNVTEIICDRNHPDQMKRMLPQKAWRAVIDFCGYTPGEMAALFSALDPARIGHFIYISTASVYAPTRELPVRESAALVDRPQPNLGIAAAYGFHKRQAETAVVQYCKEKAVPYTLLRPTIIYGPYNYAPRESYFFDQILNDEPLVIPEPDLALFQCVYVEDVATMIAASIGNPFVKDQIFNLSAPELIGYGHLADLLEQISGRFIGRRPMPIDEIDPRGVPLPFPFDSHLIFDGAKIATTLRISYTPMEIGLQKTFEWYIESRKAV